MEDFRSNRTRELSRNNPFGVSFSHHFLWEGVDLSFPGVAGRDGVLTPGVDNKLNDHLMAFKSFQDGLNAGLWLLKAAYFNQGINTGFTIGNKWAGDVTGGYGRSICQIMKVATTDVLQFQHDYLVSLNDALYRMEDGTKEYIAELQFIPDEMYVTAIAYANQKEPLCTAT